MPSEPGETFRERETGGGWLYVDPDYETAALALGLPGAEAFHRLVDAAAGASGRGATAIVSLAGTQERLHLRPCRHGGILRDWLGDRWLARSRARDELDATRRLLAQGAPVPKPLLATGLRQGPFWRTAVGTLHLEGARDGFEVLAEVGDEALVGQAAAAGRAVRRFHDAGGWHADLHLKNLMLDADGERVWVIDLDRARAADPPPAARRMHELGRLTRSLLKRGVYGRVGDRGREAFFAAYVDGDAELGRAMLATWERERRSIARHARGYADPG